MKGKNNRRGFSLLELLAVMAIMGILATVAVTGYFSAVRSMTRRRAVDNFVATLEQARQRACIDGTRMAVVCYPENTQNTGEDANLYVVCKALGRVTYKEDGLIGDEFTPLDTIFGKATTGTSGDYAFGSRRLYNLSSDKAKFLQVEGSVKPGDSGFLESGMTGAALSSSNLVWCFVPVAGGGKTDSDFNIGDLYGIEASPLASLPKNIYFSSEVTLLFNPDGSAIGGSATLNDLSVKGQKKPIATIRVESSDGSITGGGQNDVILN
jgi:prepilin-type N-terminal cleavage/methylation domain-containing protein